MRRLGASAFHSGEHPTSSTTSEDAISHSSPRTQDSAPHPYARAPAGAHPSPLATGTVSTAAAASSTQATRHLGLPPLVPGTVATAAAAAAAPAAGAGGVDALGNAHPDFSPSATTASPVGSVGEFPPVVHDPDDVTLGNTGPGGSVRRVLADDVLAPPAMPAIHVSPPGCHRSDQGVDEEASAPEAVAGDVRETIGPAVDVEGTTGGRMMTSWMPGDSFKEPPSAGVNLSLRSIRLAPRLVDFWVAYKVCMHMPIQHVRHVIQGKDSGCRAWVA